MHDGEVEVIILVTPIVNETRDHFAGILGGFLVFESSDLTAPTVVVFYP